MLTFVLDVQIKINEFEKKGQFENSSDKKYFSFFLFPVVLGRLFTIFFVDGEIYETSPVQFPKCFSLFKRKHERNSALWSFLVE